LLVQRPADTLHGATLQLALDVGRMDGGADILCRGVAADGDDAGVVIDLQIDHVHAEPGACARDVELGVAVDGSAGPARLGGELGDAERLELADVGAGGFGHAVLPNHALRVDVPDLGGTHLEFAHEIAHGVHHRKAGREGDAAAAGYEV